MKHDQILNLDPLIHAPMRLAIMSVLISVRSASFSFLKHTVNTTDGNLSTHLTRLEDAGYIDITKTFKDKKPQTSCSVTEKGRDAFRKYLEGMEAIIQTGKEQS